MGDQPGLIAIVLAGGLGTRLRDVVPDVPKVLAPVCGKPFLQHVLANLRSHGVTRIFLAVAHQGAMIEQYFGDGTRFGVSLGYLNEGAPPRGTGGALRNAMDQLDAAGDQEVLVLNGDTFVGVNVADFRAFHRSSRALLSVVITRTSNSSRYGGVVVDDNGAVSGFTEKGQQATDWINAGMYLTGLSQWRTALPSEDHYDLERRVLPQLAGRGLHAFPAQGPFIDIGVPDDYKRAAIILGCDERV